MFHSGNILVGRDFKLKLARYEFVVKLAYRRKTLLHAFLNVQRSRMDYVTAMDVLRHLHTPSKKLLHSYIAQEEIPKFM